MNILTLREYNTKNPRLSGIKLLDSIASQHTFSHITTPDIRIVPHEVFLHYLKHSTFSKEIQDEIVSEATHFITTAKTQSVAVRRAFYVPGLQSPPGPRFLGLTTPQDVIEAIKTIFDFAITHDYHIHTESKIEAFFYAFVDPPSFPVPLKNSIDIPKGGYAFSLDTKGKIVKIFAVWGNNEGTQSLGRNDEYIVDTNELIIKRKIVAQKLYGLFTTKNAPNDKLAIPLDKQFKQILSDLEILESAIMVSECTKSEKKLKTAEFSFDGSKLAFNEIIDYEVAAEQKYENTIITGNIFIVDSIADVEKLMQDTNNTIVYMSKRIIEKRDFEVLNALAAVDKQLDILYPGTTATAHAMRVLIDAGHRAFVVGNRMFLQNQPIQIVIEDTKVSIKVLSLSQKQTILSLPDAINFTRDDVGGKAMNLSRLYELGFVIPDGYVILAHARHTKNFLASKSFTTFLHNLDTKKLYSVRSSANVEDGTSNALAGQFETVINVKREDIPAAIAHVWHSSEKKHIQQIQDALHIGAIHMAVVIQEMIQPSFAGVIFGANPETKNTNEIVAEITKGLAEDVVNGTANAMKVVFNKITGEIIQKKEPNLGITFIMLEALYQMYTQVENEFNSIQDIEWTYDKNQNLYLLQTRDLFI